MFDHQFRGSRSRLEKGLFLILVLTIAEADLMREVWWLSLVWLSLALLLARGLPQPQSQRLATV
jgi:hypothetical protein